MGAILDFQFCLTLTLSGPGIFWLPGPWGGGAGGKKVPTVHNSETIHGIGITFCRVVENHKLINLVEINWQMTSSLRHNDVITVEILDFYEILPIKVRKV